MNGNGEASAQDAFRRISGSKRLEGGRGHVEPRKALVGRFKVGERVKSHFLFRGNGTFPWNGRVRWNGTCAFADPPCGFLRVALPDSGNELNHIAAAASSETIIQPLCGSNDKAALIGAFVYR